MIEKLKLKVSRFARLDSAIETQRNAAVEALNGINFQTATRGAAWLHDKSFYPGGWAADYRLLTTIFRILNDFRPQGILEFGMGETTKMLSAYAAELEPAAHVYTVEHNPAWIKFFGSNPDNLKQINVVKVEMVKTEIRDFETNYYTELINALEGVRDIELFIVDGPLGTPHMSRYNLCEVIEAGLLANEFVLLLDDAHREGEKETIAIAEELLASKGLSFRTARIMGAKKEVYAAFTDKYQFLGSV